jgi:hypothetical protein
MNTTQTTAPPVPSANAAAVPLRAPSRSAEFKKPLYEIRFEDRVGSHCSMFAKTSEDVHVIDTKVSQKVPVLVERWREKLRFSNYRLTPVGKLLCEKAIFQISETCAASFDSSYRDWGSDCMIVARTPEEANYAHALLAELFGIAQSRLKQSMPVFQILAVEDRQIRTHRTPLASRPSFSEETMDLSYGEGFHKWSAHLRSIFEKSPSSLTLLQGPPGTGKTSFLRWLIGEAQDQADFYFVPVTCIDLLSNPNLTNFWLRECGYSNRPKVLLIEDAEMLLMKRGPDNGQWVGNLLNITDGIMGDAMRFHIVCTMNCPLSDIDPALRRPGRLAASWIFRPLCRDAAEKLAMAIGKDCPEGKNLTLADIYSPPIHGEIARKLGIGFSLDN